MKTLIVLLIICSCIRGFCQSPADDRPALHETPARLVSVIDATGRLNLAASCLNVTRDVAAKKLRLFAMSVRTKTGTRRIEDFDVDVIYNYDLVAEENKQGCAYYGANNGQVFSFAIAQFAAGKRELGLRLVKLIAEVQPDFWWSIPTRAPFPIKEIVAGLEKGDDSVKELLKFEAVQWADTLKKYGP